MTARNPLVLAVVTVLLGCGRGVDRAAPYAGSWSGSWRSMQSPGVAGRIAADLQATGGRIAGTIRFESALGFFDLAVSERPPASGPTRVSGFAEASDGSSRVKVDALVELRGQELVGTYEFPVLQDAGKLVLRRSPLRPASAGQEGAGEE